MSTSTGDLTGRYVFAGGTAGKQRLDVVSEVLGAQTTGLLARAGVAAGMRCLDVGCGGGHVSRELAGMVTSTGRVVGVDLDAEVLDLAARDASAAGHANLEFRQGDAAELADGPYDVVYARFLLSHQTDPAAVLARMTSVLAPGGTVIVEDIDASVRFCHPPSAAFERASTLYRDAVRHRGGDPDIGPTLPVLLATTGMEDVAVNVHQPAGVSGGVKELVLLDLQRSATSIVAAGLASAAEIEQLLADLVGYLDDPGTVVSTPRIVQTWAKAPR